MENIAESAPSLSTFLGLNKLNLECKLDFSTICNDIKRKKVKRNPNKNNKKLKAIIEMTENTSAVARIT